jgi:glycosyltransferase involved in cell wall biosynthesis
MPSVGGAILAHMWSLPLIWHVHEIFGDSMVERLIFERLLMRADLILTASGPVANQLRSPRLQKMVRIAHTGAKVPDAVPVVEPFHRSIPQIVCVGRLNNWKGQQILIKAIGRLRDRGFTTHLRLVGDVFRNEHQFKDELKNLVTRLNLEKQVTFLGQRSDAAEQMGQADVVVLPSVRPEPFGMVVVEGMALGRPVIATRMGGPTEIIKDGYDGVLVPPSNSDALASAIANLITHPDYARQLAARARDSAIRFTPEAMASKVLAAYRELLPQG